jgi:hypothetical protein
LALRTDLLDLGFNKMKSWWKRATRAKTATELTGAKIKRLAAELHATVSPVATQPGTSGTYAE